jgi:hypothetical protein
MSISEPSSKSLPQRPTDLQKEHFNCSWNNKPTNSPNNSPVPTAVSSVLLNLTPAPSPLRERSFNKSNVWPTVPTVAGTFFPLRAALGLDEHGYSSSVIEHIVTATARFSSFRDATYAVQMSRIAISESQVRRLAREVGQELIEQRERKVVEHRRRQLCGRTAVISEVVVVEVNGDASALALRDRQAEFTRLRIRKTRSLVWPH